MTRRAGEARNGDHPSALDANAIARVRDEAWPDPRDPDELHDALTTVGFLTADELSRIPSSDSWVGQLAGSGRAARISGSGVHSPLWTAAERLPEILAVIHDAAIEPVIAAPPSRASRAWTREEALVELLRGRLAVLGPVVSRHAASPLGVSVNEAEAALQTLEGEGVVLRGRFTPDEPIEEWCDRRLLARVHRYTLNRLRAEIEPVTPAEFMRFLFAWQHVSKPQRTAGPDGLRVVLAQLDGFELAAGAWERHVLPARVQGYEPSMLDMLCFSGEIGWGRLSSPPPGRTADAAGPVRSTPVALFLREHERHWRALAASAERAHGTEDGLDVNAASVLEVLRQRGASFVHEISAAAGLEADEVHRALAALVASGAVGSDGFGGLRAILARGSRGPARADGFLSRRRPGYGLGAGGRWSIVAGPENLTSSTRYEAVERQARALLARYGIVFRRLLVRESNAASWRELTNVFRRLEARGEIRGGRFVSGMTGEQYALPDAVTAVREARRASPSDELVTLSAVDPLNLAGIVIAGERVPAVAGTRIVYRDGNPLAALEGDYVRPITPYEPSAAAAVVHALTGRAAPPVMAGFVGR
jgi:ATP-dependent Lhr-like helicase